MPHNDFPSPVPITLAGPVEISGVGLFTAKPVTVRLVPAAAESGISFRRTDLSGAPLIPVTPSSIQPEARRTILGLGHGGASVQTVEHLLSAIRGAGVTDLLVEVAGPELPIGDGSSLFWIGAMQRAGFCRGASNAVRPMVVRKAARVEAGAASVEVVPLTAEELEAARKGHGPATFYTYGLDLSDFPIPALAPIAARRIPAQQASIGLPLNANPESISRYAAEVAPARTFSLVEEAQMARQAGLFLHVSPKELLVIGDQGPIDNAYKFANEPARHKLLDLIGDLALAGRPIIGRVVASRSGHALNQEMARLLAAH